MLLIDGLICCSNSITVLANIVDFRSLKISVDITILLYIILAGYCFTNAAFRKSLTWGRLENDFGVCLYHFECRKFDKLQKHIVTYVSQLASYIFCIIMLTLLKKDLIYALLSTWSSTDCMYISNFRPYFFKSQFTDDPTLAVCNDSGGSVFELNFKWVPPIVVHPKRYHGLDFLQACHGRAFVRIEMLVFWQVCERARVRDYRPIWLIL